MASILDGIEINLRPDEVRRLLETESACDEFMPVLDRLENCGVPCQEARAFLESIKRNCEVIKAEFVDPKVLADEMRMKGGNLQ